MKRTQVGKDGVLKPLRKEHKAALNLIEQLDAAVVGLQFEGKTSIGRHLKQIRCVIDFFLERFSKHTELEEQIIFPYLASHIPKLGLVLPLLCSQHKELRKSIEDLELLIELFSNNVSKIDQAKTIQKIREIGIYLIYLLRHHIEVEHTSIYKMFDSELRKDEKEQLGRRVKENLALTNGNGRKDINLSNKKGEKK